jgi:TolB protein
MLIRSITAGLILGALALAAPAQASPERIAFVRDGDVFTMRPDGSAVKRLTALGPDRRAVFETWSPDGRRLAFTVQPADGPAEIWTMNADGSGRHRLLDDPGVDDFTPSFTPDGRHVVFVRCSEDGCAIHRVRSDGRRLEPVAPASPGVDDWAPSYSPDGRTILFGSFGRGGVEAATYLMGARGLDVRPLGPPDLQLFPGEWAPDGSRIALYSNCCNTSNSDIWAARADGSALRQLMDTPGENEVLPTWSPRGNAIAFERVRPDFSASDVFVMRADGTRVRLLQRNARYPRWSPPHRQ